MTVSGWQRTWVRILTTVLTIAMLLIIFFFSMENAENSDRRSGVFANIMICLFRPEYPHLSPEEQQKIYDDISLIVRKCAHFAEYTLLGLILRFCLESWFGQRFRSVYTLSLISFAGSVIYAGTDELHQLMIDGRSGQFTDVLVDSCGALTGIILGTLLIARSGARKRDGG